MALTKLDLAESLSSKVGIDKKEAGEFVDLFFEEMRILLEGGNNIKLSGFGNFNLRDKKARPGRNPKTGKEIAVTARRVVTFRAGQKLKARIEKYADPTEVSSD